MTEEDLLQMVKEFPDSPMGFFSLGKLYLEQKRFQDAASHMAQAVKLDPGYAAAWVALGDAYSGAGEKEKAKAAWQAALDTPHGRKDVSLQEDLEQRLADL